MCVMLVMMTGVGGDGEATAGDLPPWSPDANAERSAIPEVYRWDLSALVADDAVWETEAVEAREMVDRVVALREGVETPDGLLRYLDAFFSADEVVNRITLYANLQRDTHSTDAGAIARHQRALALTNRLMEEGPVIRRAVLSMSEEEMSAAIRQAPGLERFRPYLGQLRRRAAHVLTPDAERVLALAGDNLWAQIDLNELPSSSEDAFAALMSELPLPVITDADGNQVQLTLANYGRYRASADRRVRKETVEGMFATLRDFENTLAATLAGQAEFDVFLARARGYDSALDAYLDKDDIDPAVFRNLIAAVRAHADALHRYVRLRRQALGVDEVHLYDLYVPMVEGVDRDIPYPQAMELILAALEPLGDDYLEQISIGLDPRSGWIDVYPSKGKQSGAFSAAVYGVHPFIKMNYQDRFDDVSTLAHEYGHAMHSRLSMESQPYLTWRYVPFLAEIASTCNEALLSRYMIDHAGSDAERAWLLSELAETIRTTIYRQTMFAEFELEVHELVESGEAVTAERLNQVYHRLLRDYYGPDYVIGPDDDLEWAYIPHFYWKYYVYNYATGLASGIALAQRLSGDVEGAREAYLEMLRAGSSRPPLEILRSAGVDLTRPDAIDDALELFGRTVDELTGLVGR